MRQVAIAVVQLALILCVLWFARNVLVPYGGIIGALAFLAAMFLLAGWFDGTRWKFSVAFTVLAVANFALLLVILKFAGNWGLVWLVPFLWFGYRLASVAESRATPRI